MRAALYNGPHAIEVGERPDPVIIAPTDAVVRVVVGLRGGVAPARAYILSFSTMSSKAASIQAASSTSRPTSTASPKPYAAMDERGAIKSLLRIGTKETDR